MFEPNLEFRLRDVLETKMKSPVKASLAVILLFTLSVISSAKPVPVTAPGSVQPPPACVDTTPHKEMLVRVDTGVQLQVLDWGGSDKPRTMVLLTGLGDNAHIYDQFAFQFTDYFHVIGITRRGFLPSSQPEPGPTPGAGYDFDTRARDDIAVLDALGVRTAVVVGHSVAGSELSTLAIKYPDRIDKLVYLDAFDLSKRFQLPEIPSAPYTDADYRSVQIFLAASERLEDIPRPAPASCIGFQFNQNGAIIGSTTPPTVSPAILLGAKTSPPTDWTKVEAPRLGIFDQPSVEGKLALYWYLSAEDKKQFDENWPGIVHWYTDRISEFAVAQGGRPKPIVYTLPDAPHYFYFNDQAFVVRVMREFLLGKVLP